MRVRWGRLGLALLVTAAIVAGLGALGLMGLRRFYERGLYRPGGGGAAPQGSPVSAPQRVNVLVLGVDTEGGRSDTMLLASLDPVRRTLGVLSIPRDTRTEIAGLGRAEKIAHAHAYGPPQYPDMSGAQRAKRTVAELLGVPVHYYVTINLQGFVRIVDRLGGVDFDVPFDMNYDDPYQNFHIHLRKGYQHLDGRKALQLVRYRHDNADKNGNRRGYPDGDVGRVAMQQRFMRALLDKLFQVGTILRLPALAGDLAELVDTDVPPGEVVRLARVGVGLQKQNIRFGILPGEPGDPREGYFLPDHGKMRAVVDDLLRGVDRAGNAAVRVEVWNGTAVPGQAERLARLLREQGFDVVRVQVAPRTDYRNTLLIGHGGLEKLEPVALAVGRLLPSARKRIDQAGGAADVTVIVGEDFGRSLP